MRVIEEDERGERKGARGGRKEDQELQRFVALCEKQLNKVAGKALCKCAAGSRNVCEAPLCGCMSKHFTYPLVAQRFEGTFHVFAKAKTFHFSAERRVAQTLSLYLPKNFTSVEARHASAYRYCSAAQDISALRTLPHFTFLLRQKHFTFRRLICSLFAHFGNAEKFHSLCTLSTLMPDICL